MSTGENFGKQTPFGETNVSKIGGLELIPAGRQKELKEGTYALQGEAVILETVFLMSTGENFGKQTSPHSDTKSTPSRIHSTVSPLASLFHHHLPIPEIFDHIYNQPSWRTPAQKHR
jgi:hypothetical protein